VVILLSRGGAGVSGCVSSGEDGREERAFTQARLLGHSVVNMRKGPHGEGKGCSGSLLRRRMGGTKVVGDLVEGLLLVWGDFIAISESQVLGVDEMSAIGCGQLGDGMDAQGVKRLDEFGEGAVNYHGLGIGEGMAERLTLVQNLDVGYIHEVELAGEGVVPKGGAGVGLLSMQEGMGDVP